MTGRFSVEYSPEEDDWSSVCGADVALVEKGRILAKSTESGTVSQLNQPLITEHQPPGCRSKAAKAALPLVFEFHCFFHRNLSLSGFKSRRTSCSQTHWWEKQATMCRNLPSVWGHRTTNQFKYCWVYVRILCYHVFIFMPCSSYYHLAQSLTQHLTSNQPAASRTCPGFCSTLTK